MKKIISSFILGLFLIGNTYAATELVSDYTFNENEMIGLKATPLTEDEKTEFELNQDSSYYLVSVALRASSGATIDMIEANVEVDKDTFEVIDPELNIADGDIFTDISDKNYNPENGFVSFNATTDVAYEQVDPNEAFGFILKVKDTNPNETGIIKINPNDFRISSSADSLTNLLTEELTIELTGLPIAEVTTPVVDTPVIETTTPEPELVVEKVEEVETGIKETAAIVLILLSLLISFGLIYKKQ